jgi:hypothetical protein
MTNQQTSRQRYANARTRVVASHKFDLGANVACKLGFGGERGVFRVTRHLPDGGQGLQYRIQSEKDGQERVVVETALERVSVAQL